MGFSQYGLSGGMFLRGSLLIERVDDLISEQHASAVGVHVMLRVLPFNSATSVNLGICTRLYAADKRKGEECDTSVLYQHVRA